VPSIIAALAKQGVEVGRPFPALSTFLRVTIGTSSEMKSFLNAFRAVME
jgi:histidinol-phosphate/aromatic aminotransferase/cobyric acid decarboxylase-like protein